MNLITVNWQFHSIFPLCRFIYGACRLFVVLIVEMFYLVWDDPIWVYLDSDSLLALLISDVVVLGDQIHWVAKFRTRAIL